MLIAIAAVIVILIGVFIFLQTKSGADEKPLVANTIWHGGDNSEVVFTENRIDWYQSPDDHDDNYFSGNYTFYIGKDAVKYITENLADYGVTEDDLARVFATNGPYNESNFVVFDIKYDKFLLSGEEQAMERPLVPWYGFILNENTYLDVANMNTGTLYGFTKQ